MVIRVPVADFYETVDALEKVAELESSNKSSENVSLQVIDNQVRIRAQERSLRRIEILLDRAETVRDIVSIESELTPTPGRARLAEVAADLPGGPDVAVDHHRLPRAEGGAAEAREEGGEDRRGRLPGGARGRLVGADGLRDRDRDHRRGVAAVAGRGRDPRAADLARVAAPRPRPPPAPAGPDPLGATMAGVDDLTAPLAVLIDADNTSAKYAGAVLDEAAKYGRPTVRRAYGDWSSERLKGWKVELNRRAIQPIQQFAYTTGKNSTDFSLVIDAMDLLYAGHLGGFVLVSSDSDFTRLATRLQESGKPVYGIGRQATPSAFQSACTQFIYLENIEETPSDPDAGAGDQRGAGGPGPATPPDHRDRQHGQRQRVVRAGRGRAVPRAQQLRLRSPDLRPQAAQRPGEGADVRRGARQRHPQRPDLGAAAAAAAAQADAPPRRPPPRLSRRARRSARTPSAGPAGPGRCSGSRRARG